MPEPKKPKPEDAPAFSQIFEDPKFKRAYNEREEHAAAARTAQDSYKAMMRLFIAATTITAILGALSLYGDVKPSAEAKVVGTHFKDYFSRDVVRVGLHVLQFVAVVVAGFSAFMMANRRYLDNWREHRKLAEEGRLKRAKVALEQGHAKGPVAFQAAGQFLVDDLVTGQIEWLTKAIEKHDKHSLWQTVVTGGVLAMAGGAPVLMAAGASGLSGLSGLVLFGALAAVVAPALIAGFRSWSDATGSAERVTLHKATKSMLRDAEGHRADLDAAIAAHDLAGALAYAEKVFAALRTDVEGFLKIMGAAPTPPAPAAPGSKT